MIQARSGARTLKAPEVLDLANQTEDTLSFLNELTAIYTAPGWSKLIVDLRPATRISTDAAIVLLAKITHAAKSYRRCRLFYFAPKNKAVNELLRKIGFYDHFPLFHKRYCHLNSLKRTFVHYRTGRLVDSTPIGELVEQFNEVMHWSSTHKKGLYNALIECLTNVLGHAYPEGYSDSDWIRHRWWIVGQRDVETGEIWFCCYDLGVGIPKTIRFRLRDQPWLLGPTDEELIVKGVVEGAFSRMKLPTRGKGLPVLRRFVVAAQDGELLIVSHQSRCQFPHSGPPKTSRLHVPLHGTLIVWSLRARPHEDKNN